MCRQRAALRGCCPALSEGDSGRWGCVGLRGGGSGRGRSGGPPRQRPALASRGRSVSSARSWERASGRPGALRGHRVLGGAALGPVRASAPSRALPAALSSCPGCACGAREGKKSSSCCVGLCKLLPSRPPLEEHCIRAELSLYPHRYLISNRRMAPVTRTVTIM